MAELSKKQEQYIKDVERNTPSGATLTPGWPDAEHGITHTAYLDWAHALIDDLPEDADIGAFQTYAEWVQMKRNEDPDRDNLGFSHCECDLCGALPGDRYAVSGIVDKNSKFYHYALSVCGDCLQYIANGELPDDENL